MHRCKYWPDTYRQATDLQEDFAKYPVGFFPERGGEDDGDAVRRRLHVDDLLVSVVQGHEFPLTASGRLQLFLFLEGAFKRSGESVPLEQSNRLDLSIALLCEHRRGERTSFMQLEYAVVDGRELTTFRRQLLKVDLEAHVVIGFRLRDHQTAVLSLQEFIHSVLDELAPTADVHREKKVIDGLFVRSGELETDTVKVDELYVDIAWSSAVREFMSHHRDYVKNELGCLLRQSGLYDVVLWLAGERCESVTQPENNQ